MMYLSFTHQQHNFIKFFFFSFKQIKSLFFRMETATDFYSPPQLTKRMVNFGINIDIKNEPEDFVPLQRMQKVPSLSDLSETDSGVEAGVGGQSVVNGGPPPLTPGTTKNFGDVLRTTYGTWDADRERLGIPRDPRLWSQEHVSAWLAIHGSG